MSSEAIGGGACSYQIGFSGVLRKTREVQFVTLKGSPGKFRKFYCPLSLLGAFTKQSQGLRDNG